MRMLIAPLALGLGVLVAGCTSSDEPDGDSDRIVLTPASDGAGHSHAPGEEHAEEGPIGDGSAASAGGYELASVRLPATADGPGEVSFRILDGDGEVVEEYVEEQTRDLHLYVVRADLSSFRHLHPVLDGDGTWRAQVDLGVPGPWRVVAEFTPEGSGRPVVLGTTLRVPGDWERVAVARDEGAGTGDDGVVRAAVDGGASVGDDGRLQVVVSSLDGEPLTLGSYLGTSAHLTGFAVDSRRVVHVHPYGAPEQDSDGTVLTFHTTFTEAGDYRMFLQVRVEGLLHTVPLTVTVS